MTASPAVPERSSAQRAVIVAAYVLGFWGLVPALVLVPALLLDARLGLGLSRPGLRAALGLPLALGAAVLLAAAIREYRRITGELPISALPSLVLVETGPFAVWRHPIYLGFTALLAGIGLLLGSGALLLLVLPGFVGLTWGYAWLEERALVRRLGRRATAHLRRTAWVIPRPQLCLHLPVRPLLWAWVGLTVRRRDRLPRHGPFFVVAAHRSYPDPLFVASALRRPVSFVTTGQVMRGPWLGAIFGALGCIPRERHRRDPGAARRILRALDEGAVIGLFPEGERSWTGGLGPLRREALELLRHRADVPIVPLRIEGNYHCWPRWAPGPRRARVRVTVMPTLTASANEPLERLATRLAAAIAPDDAGCTVSHGARAAGLARLLYRCPGCRTDLSLAAAAGDALACPSCAARFVLSPALRLHDVTRPDSPELTLAAAYDAVRAGELVRPDPSRLRALGVALAPDEAALALTAGVRCAEERGDRLEHRFEGALLLTDHRLLALPKASDPAAGERAVERALAALTSVTVESNDRLRLHGERAPRLLELRFLEDSVLRWQDLVVEAVAARRGQVPNRS